MSRYDDIRKRYEKQREAAGMSRGQPILPAEGPALMPARELQVLTPSDVTKRFSSAPRERPSPAYRRWHAVLFALDVLAISVVLLSL